MLKATVIIDYQNVQLVSVKLFKPLLPRHAHYIHPYNFSQTLMIKRNKKHLSQILHGTVTKILVYRGLPSPYHDAKDHERNLQQAKNWKTKPEVIIFQRPLRYSFLKDNNEQFLLDKNGKRIVIKREEKGIDVLCALALVREARTSDLVILASQDTDLVPAIEEAIALKQAKIETFSWYSKSSRQSFELRSPVAPTWNTRLGEEEYFQCLDENTYGV